MEYDNLKISGTNNEKILDLVNKHKLIIITSNSYNKLK